MEALAIPACRRFSDAFNLTVVQQGCILKRTQEVPRMPLRASAFRENIYRILDEILETGLPVYIERKGKLLRIGAVEPKSKLANLKPRDLIVGNPEDLVHSDWSEEWRP